MPEMKKYFGRWSLAVDHWPLFAVQQRVSRRRSSANGIGIEHCLWSFPGGIVFQLNKIIGMMFFIP